MNVTGLDGVFPMLQVIDAPVLVEPVGAGLVTGVDPCFAVWMITSHGASAVQEIVLVPVFLMVIENALKDVADPPAVAACTTWMLAEVAALLAKV